MITITKIANNISMDRIELAIKKENIQNEILNSDKYFFEFDLHKKLITISTRHIYEFCVNEEIVNFENITAFLIKNKALVDDEFIIVPCYSMSLYINFEERIFLEILIYSESERDLYEKQYLKLFSDSIDDEIIESSDITFIPFESIGVYSFGESEESFLNHTKLSYHNDRGINGKKYYDYKDFVFRFDQDKLSQVCIYKFNMKILFNNININTDDGVIFLLDKYPAIKSRSHTIFLSIGLAIRNKIKKEEGIEFCFFNEELTRYWGNIHRPITSW